MTGAKDGSLDNPAVHRVRKICLALPDASEKLSHGEPAFFANKRLFATISNNHHNDGHVAVWIPARPGEQEALIAEAPEVYYRPPYVGVKGWVGIELERIGDEQLGAHLTEAWRLIQSLTSKTRQTNKK